MSKGKLMPNALLTFGQIVDALPKASTKRKGNI